MTKFATKQIPPNVKGGVTTTGQRMYTHEGGVGWERNAKSELFLLAAANMVGEKTFYEDRSTRDPRFVDLIHQVTKEDPEWVAALVPFLRTEMLMRSASVVMAAEYVKAGGPNGRRVVDAAVQRPDEPAEMLAYWMQEHGRAIPKPVKRGVADAVRRLYTERAVLKYDGKTKAWRMADVVELVHPRPVALWQGILFKYLLDARRRVQEIPASLETLSAVARWDGGLPLPDGVTWERLSGTRTMDREAWEAVIPQMGLMALTRNLRNFDEAGIGNEAAALVEQKLRDPEEVRKSRQLPIRFYSAWKNVGTMRWGPALEQALKHSLSNVSELPGKTLILVDLSGSMSDRLSNRSTVERWEVAAVFGAALASRCESVNLVIFSDDSAEIKLMGSVLRIVESLRTIDRGGTNTFQAVQRHYAGHDRVVILTDEQAHDAGLPVPDTTIYTFNLAGYRPGHLASGEKGQYTFGGLSDAAFRLLPILEAHKNGEWSHLDKTFRESQYKG